MRVVPIAVTRMLTDETNRCLTDQWVELEGTDADCLSEFAGRACYESWDKPNPKTATNEGYLRNILGHEHFSVLEHSSVTFYLIDVSRTLTHELVRHRHLSFSQRSQRYVDEEHSGYVTPEAIRDLSDAELSRELTEELRILNEQTRNVYHYINRRLREAGFKVKQAREAARAALLGSTHTNIVVTGNHRAWRDFLHKRWHVAADNEIRRLAGMILGELKEIAPHTYQDFHSHRPFGAPGA